MNFWNIRQGKMERAARLPRLQHARICYVVDSRLMDPSPRALRARILIANDEPVLVSALTRGLALTGYEVEAVHSGRQALQALQARPYDILILDLSVPDMNGSEVMDRALQSCPDLLVLALAGGEGSLESAIAAVKHRVLGYLLKATSPEGTLQAVTGVLERCSRRVQERVALRTLTDTLDLLHGQENGLDLGPPATPRHMVHVPPLLLDMRERTVTIDGGMQHVYTLTRGETEVLGALMRRPGQVLSVQELGIALTGLPQGTRTMQGAIAHYIHRLRSKLESDPGKPRWIRTVWGVGYLFVAEQH